MQTEEDDPGLCKFSVEAYVLPKSVTEWPTFAEYKKQQAALSKDVLCFSTENQAWLNTTIDALRSGDWHVVALGAPGIGKSAEMNYLLMRFIQNIHLGKWPKHVLFRIPGRDLIEICWKKTNKNGDRIMVKEHVGIDTLSSVKEFTSSFNKKTEGNVVMFMELDEDEVDPKSDVCTFIPLSNRDAATKLKTIMADRTTRRLLVVPPCCEEIRLQAKAFHKFSRFGNFFLDKSLEEVDKIVHDRSQAIGCIPRIVSGDEYSFRKRIENILSPVELKRFFAALKGMKIDNMPSPTEYYIAPELKWESDEPPSIHIADNQYYFKFLSDFCAFIVGKNLPRESDELLWLKKMVKF